MSLEKQLRNFYLHACEIELQAFKPGNVSVYSEGHDMTVEDFRISANVSALEITNPVYSLGEKIYYAVKATRNAVGCNTNLGIILLCAPMIQAAYNKQANQTFQDALSALLKNTTVEDADWVFKAICLASPGGLGESDQEDVGQKSSTTLVEAMAIAQDRDRIALQFVTDFSDIFNFALIQYNKAQDLWGDQNWAAVAVYTALLSEYTDSHIERKYGKLYSALVHSLMSLANKELFNNNKPEDIIPLLQSIDQILKFKGINPGTTADLTVATVLAVDLLSLFH